jgi:hypothetical protein
VLQSGPPAPQGGYPEPCFGWIVLPRHGQRPLRFSGRLLVRTDDREHARLARRPLWCQILAFEREDGGVAACVTHIVAETSAHALQGAPWRQAWCDGDAATLLATLRAHDPGHAFPLAGHDLTAERAAWAALVQAAFGAPL